VLYKEYGSTWLEIENEWTDEQYNMFCLVWVERMKAQTDAQDGRRSPGSRSADMILGPHRGGGNYSQQEGTIWDLPREGASQYPNLKSAKGKKTDGD